MKKIISMVLVLILMICVCTGCGGSGEIGDNALAQLLNEGYINTASSCTEGVFKGLYTLNDGEKIALVEIKLSSSEQTAYEALDITNEEDEDDILVILTNAEDVTITDMTEKIPSEEQLKSEYVGKTIGELEDMGFENTGNTNDEGTVEFFYDGPEYYLKIGVEEGLKIDLDDYSNNDIRALEIAKAEFLGFVLND